MNYNFYLIDAFTTVQFKGNPAGVCILNEDISDELMMKYANEFGVSETAFINIKTNNLRWFTPKVEIALCGHATLATILAIKDLGLIQDNENINFITKSGILKAFISNEIVTLNFPLGNIPKKEIQDNGIIHSLGIKSNIEFYGKSGTKILIEISDENEVINLKPNFENLIRQKGYGVIVTASSSGEYDFLSRYFHPWAGVNEDPVTGSAHCILASYYKEKFNKDKMIGSQVSSRGGIVAVEILNSERVNLIGRGAIIMRGNI